MAGLRTEFPFTLPKGFVDGDGVVHRDGTMRLATARDELEPLSDPKVRDADDPHLTVIVLARVITQLGHLTRLSPRDIEGLFAADLAYLQDVYSTINYGTDQDIARFLEEVNGSRGGGTASTAAPALPPTGSPVSDAARSLLANPTAASVPLHLPDESPFDGGDDDGSDQEPIPSRAPRRARIEEVGRSTGRPGGV